MTTTLILSALLLGILTLLPISTSKVWWIRALDFPRLQISILIGLWLLVALVGAAGNWTVPWFYWLVMIGSLVYQLWWIYPNSALGKKEVASVAADHDNPELTLLISNVLMDNRDAQPLIELIGAHNPDIFATLESDAWWQQQLDGLLTYPNRLACPLDNKYGMHVYSRLPIVDGYIDYLVEDDVPSMSLRVLLDSGDEVRVHIVHPKPPVIGESTSSIERDVELLIFAKKLKKIDEPTIVTGDLNDVAWSKTTRLFRRMSGLLDLRTGRGMFNTYNADHWFIRWPLDHIFVSSHFRVVEVCRLCHMGSDHFPVFAKLALGTLDPGAAHLKLEDADQELISETLESTAAGKAVSPSLEDK